MKMRLLFASLCMTWTASLAVHAQSVSPLRQSAGSFGQNFLVRVQIANTYDTAQIGEIFLYDTDWNPIAAKHLSHETIKLAPKARMQITAIVPFEGYTTRIIHICHSILPRVGGVGMAYRGEACSKVTARRLHLD